MAKATKKPAKKAGGGMTAAEKREYKTFQRLGGVKKPAGRKGGAAGGTDG